MMRYCNILFGILLSLLIAGSANAQQDRFGELDRVYLDSVDAVVGQNVSVRCYLKNDESLSIVSVPLAYDQTRMTLKSITFDGSRAGHIQTKIITPAQPADAQGHFVVAIVKMTEAPLAPGEGLLFTANFTVSASLAPGSVIVLDSLFYPPGGELMLTENSTAEAIRPAFAAGKVIARQINRPPSLEVASSIAVLEGDSLTVAVKASDPDGNPLKLACTSKPTGAVFTAAGANAGKLTWVPDFVGPFSAEVSPIKLTFWVSDGQTSSEQDVMVQVINRNRTPVVQAPPMVNARAGNKLEFAVTASDPDFEAVTWTVEGAPRGASVASSANCSFSWTPALTADDDTMSIRFIGSDPQGSADTAEVIVTVQSATLYYLSIDTITAYPGDQVTVDVDLDNQVEISGFNLLLQYDVSVLGVVKVEAVGTRTASFETFAVTHNVNGLPGTVRIVGVSSAAGPGVSPLPVGSGAIARITFQTSGDLAYEGLSVPVRFLFNDVVTKNDNTLSSTSGTKIEQTELGYADGYVRIADIGDIRVGDVNLNGLAYEISDAIYFTNHFINPAQYPFNALQYANSDINGDNIAATISDLVRLINIIVNGGFGGKTAATTGALSATVRYATGATTTVDYQADFAVGGVVVTLVTGQPVDLGRISCTHHDMTIDASQRGDTVTVLVYSLTGETLPSGSQCLLTIDGLQDAVVSSVDMSTAAGEYVAVTVAPKTASLPSEFILAQNYPNPFNPDTKIDFSLPAQARVTLTVYDVLGRTVQVLAEGDYPAGHHTVTWSGRDGSGQGVASGVYFYRLDAGGTTVTRKMMLVK